MSAAAPTRILVVDDDEGFRRSVVRALARSGYDCTVASDGAEVVDTVRRTRPDLILMDVTMPRRSGLEALRDLRTAGPTKRIPVIIMPARTDLMPSVASIIGPHDGRIAKPLDPDELQARIEELLAVNAEER